METLDYTRTATILAEAAGRAVGSLVNKCIKENSLTFKVYTKLYNSCVVPIMDYCCGIWGYAKYDKPNTIQNRALRSFLGEHRYTSNIVINGDVAWITPVVRRKVEMVKLLQRMIEMSENRTTNFIFIWDGNHKGKTWSWSIKQILKETHQEELINSVFDGTVNFKEVIDKTKEELMKIEVEKWKVELDKQPKLRFYKLFKSDYVTEPSYI